MLHRPPAGDAADDAGLNGIDFLEVADLAPGELDADEAAEYASLPVAERDRLLWERRLSVAFVNPLTAQHKAALTPERLRISGGERPDSRNIGVAVLAVGADGVVLRATRSGDFSVYRLSLVTSALDATPPAGFDPLLSAVDFSFKVDCPTDFDCLPRHICPPDVRPAIDLDYLARDYATFRRLLLDRIGALDPDWRERHVPDVGITLVELMAYVGDYLAYRQDAVATEAYLGTARRRISVKRHARLVDYAMHDGCSARAWVQVLVDDTVPAAGSFSRGSTPSPTSRPASSPVSPAPRRWTSRHLIRRSRRSVRRSSSPSPTSPSSSVTTGWSSTRGAPRTAASPKARRAPRSTARSPRSRSVTC